MTVHFLFDVLAALSSFVLTLCLYSWRLKPAGDRITHGGMPYALSLVSGAVVGAYVFGTANLWLSGQVGIGRSILGALIGAIAAVEFYKWLAGMIGSTGVIFAPAFALSIGIGRIGCYLSGLDDFTYGTVTQLPWGHDFGDGAYRHPVQIYESITMFSFCGFALFQLGRSNPYFLANGFYLMVLTYAVQRFLWEFLKPYQMLLGPFNLFHFGCAALFIYAVVMIRSTRAVPAPT